jgi:imidazolonepropionase-like amidohydrolase
VGTYFADITVFDGRTLRQGAGVLISEGAIQWVGSHNRAPRETRAAVPVDGRGRTLSPGLIDCHVHLCFDGTPDFVAEARTTEPYAAVKCVANAARHLASGVTTVRDLGGFRDVATDVGRAIDDGRVPGPRVVASGTALTVTGGHGWNTFARQTDGPDAMRAAVREQIRAGARSIKIVATGGVLTPGVGVDFTAFTRDEVEAAVDEAHKWGVPIAAHAIGRTGIAFSVAAGIDSIEHGSQIDAEIARDMKAGGTFHVPTIAALWGIISNPDDVPEYAVAKGLQIWEMAQDAFRRSVRAGVRIACGTDAGTPHNPHGSAPREVVSMVEWGLTPLKALQAATAAGADLLRIADRVGRIEAGKAADVVLYEGNPIDDPTILLTPTSVWKEGELVAGSSAESEAP